jgi:uncharacterized protein (TIGR04255 family)
MVTKHYSRSPLTEAVIDLRVKLSREVELETLASIQSVRKKDYPTRQDRIALQGQFTTDPKAPPATASRTHIGYSFTSIDKRQIVQARLDGFAFSRLAPYESWESFRDEARQWWDTYRTVTKPEEVIRVAVRYINRLDLPLPLEDFTDYLRTTPEVSPDLPQLLSGYFMQLQIPQEDLRGMLILNQTIVPPPNPQTVSILLDIDLFRESDIPREENELWDFFEQLRVRKNEVFEACITEQMRGLIL